MSARCEQCRFWRQWLEPHADRGDCRRYPPPQEAKHDIKFSLYPVVALSWDCGEFQPHTTASPDQGAGGDPAAGAQRDPAERVVDLGPLLAVARAVYRTMTDPDTSAAVSGANLHSLGRVLADLEGIADSTGFTK